MTTKKAAKARKSPAKPEPLTVVYRPTDSIVPDPQNARTHSPAQVEQICASIREFGWTNPILLRPNGMAGAGHARLLAAKALGMAEVPTITLSGLTDAQWRAYALADNKLALNAGWDLEILSAEITDLQVSGFDLDLLGFSDLELGEIGISGFTPEERIESAEETPEVPDAPVVRPGELWLLGDHRVLCGDSTKAEDVARLLDGAKPHLMTTDPPYGVEYDANWRNETGIAEDGSLQRMKTGRVRKSIGAKAVGKVMNDGISDWREAWMLFPGDVAYVWHADRHATSVDLSLQSVGFQMRAQIIWNKMRMIIGRGDYHFAHEPCWYAVRKGKAGRWAGDRKQTTIWDISHRASETGHSTQKPIECMRRPILNNSKPGDAVCDPFLGSGTTLIAAEMEGRKCLGLELSPAYVQVIIERWQGFTGKTAIREDGATLEALTASPAPKSKPKKPARRKQP